MSIDLMFYLYSLLKFTTGFLIIATYLKLTNKLQASSLPLITSATLCSAALSAA